MMGFKIDIAKERRFGDETKELFRQWCEVAKSSEIQFFNAYKKGCEDWGGNNFMKCGSLQNLFRNVQNEAKELCVDQLGMNSNTFHGYCQATRKALTFDVPWSLARTCTIFDLDRARKLAKSYGDGTAEQRMKRALSQVKTEKKAMSEQQPRFFGLPEPNEGESSSDFCRRFFQSLKCHLESNKMKPYLEGNSSGAVGMRNLYNICAEHLLKVVA